MFEPRAVHSMGVMLASDDLPAAGAQTAQLATDLFFLAPDTGQASSVGFVVSYTGAAAAGQWSGQVLWTIDGTEVAEPPILGPAFGDLLPHETPVSIRTREGATAVRMLLAEVGDPTNPGLAALRATEAEGDIPPDVLVSQTLGQLAAGIVAILLGTDVNVFGAPVVITRNVNGTINTIAGTRNGVLVTRTYAYDANALIVGWTEV